MKYNGQSPSLQTLPRVWTKVSANSHQYNCPHSPSLLAPASPIAPISHSHPFQTVGSDPGSLNPAPSQQQSVGSHHCQLHPSLDIPDHFRLGSLPLGGQKTSKPLHSGSGFFPSHPIGCETQWREVSTVCVCVCVCVCMCVWMYVHIYIYVCIYVSDYPYVDIICECV